MNKKDFNLLGNIFSCEIDGRLPFQSKNKGYLRLAEDGLCVHVKHMRAFNDGLPSMEIAGWELTNKGRLEYCEACDKYFSAEEIAELEAP